MHTTGVDYLELIKSMIFVSEYVVSKQYGYLKSNRMKITTWKIKKFTDIKISVKYFEV